MSRPIFDLTMTFIAHLLPKKKLEIPQLIQLQPTPKSRLHFSLLLSRSRPFAKTHAPLQEFDPGGLILGPHLCACEVAVCGAVAQGGGWW